jgi:predicted Fe-Mo cluster-binding NifX family protein
MKIAISTYDDRTVGGHLGRASRFFIYTVDQNQPASRELRLVQPIHAPEGSGLPNGSHEAMVLALSDCAAVLTGGIGPGMVRALNAAGITAVVTDESDPEAAVRDFLAGQLIPAQAVGSCGCGCHGHSS